MEAADRAVASGRLGPAGAALAIIGRCWKLSCGVTGPAARGVMCQVSPAVADAMEAPSPLVRSRFLFMGSQQANRNPADHEQFGEMDDDEAF